MKKKISAILAMILTISCLPINIKTNAETSAKYLSWCSDWCNQLDDEVSFIVTGVYEGTVEKGYAVRDLQKGNVIGTMYFGNVQLEGKEELEVGDMFYVTSEWLLIAEIEPAEIGIMHEQFNGNAEVPELELKYIANGIELWGDSFVEALRNQLNWELKQEEYYGDVFYDIGILAVEDTDKILKGDVNENGEVDILDIIVVNKAILGQTKLSISAQKASDIDGDSIVSPSDSLAIMTYIVGLTEEL
ncbi:MAG: dockerin type I repeat-containing protein [Oscillospiraceae bacterium]|nr:dockerin type I repeat-containing protein [Oscillospiraceae bacterium]